jgi:mono/diheme cytochrome c family protein
MLIMSRLIPLLSLLAMSVHAAPPSDPVLLAGHVHVIFERKCNSCHGAHLKKPDGRFGYVLDLQRMAANPDYILPKSPQKSELFRLIRDGEMPPEDHPKTPPLTEDEREHVRAWIAAGAPHELPKVLPTRYFNPPPTSHPASSDPFKKKRVSLDFRAQPAGLIFAEIEKQCGLKIDYTKPARESQLSIITKNLTVLEALEYLALNANLRLSFDGDKAELRAK